MRDEKSAFSASYEPAGNVFEARPGSLEHFLTERYCLYAAESGTLYRAEIHHPPWPLPPAEATIDLNTMPPAHTDVTGNALFHYSARQDVAVWPLQRLA